MPLPDRAASCGTVVYIGHFDLPDRNAAAHRVRGNARILRDLGYRVILLGATRAKASKAELEPADSGEHGIEAWHMAYPGSRREWLARIGSADPLRAVLAAARVDDLALTICYNYPALAQARIARLARRLGARAVADCTEWYAREREGSLASLIKNMDTPLRMLWINRRMDGLITTSPFITRFYADRAQPIVELPTIQRRAVELISVSPTPGDRRRLVFAGSGLDPKSASKGREGLKDRLDWVLELLGAARKRGARFHLDVFGISEADYRILIPSHGALLQELRGCVTFHGRVPHAAVLGSLMAADFSIFLRRETRLTKAGFASKFSESITYGTPVICTHSPSLERWMEEGVNGFRIDCSDMAAAGERLAQILSLPADRVRAMKAACAARQPFAHEHFIEPVADWLMALGLPARVLARTGREKPAPIPSVASHFERAELLCPTVSPNC